MNLSCELPKLECLKKPSQADIDKLKEKNIVPPEIIDRIFKDLEKEYNALKKHTTKSKSKSKSKTLKSKSKSKSKTPKSKTRSRTKSKVLTMKTMKGGTLSDFAKNKIVDMVILLIAGASYWWVLPMLETWVIALGIMPKLCGQNIAEHVFSNLTAPEGQSCHARAVRYDKMVKGLLALVTGSAWFSRAQFTKENLSANYNKVHKLVKKSIFGSSTPSPRA